MGRRVFVFGVYVSSRLCGMNITSIEPMKSIESIEFVASTGSGDSRLASSTAWSPTTNQADVEFVQIDLDTVLNVTGVRIQKAADQMTAYVTRVLVEVGTDAR